MSYSIKEIFYTLQGEGANTGTPAVFCRFAGCNLACDFCDTDFAGGYPMETLDIVNAAINLWPDRAKGCPFIVLTGGEPGLQVNDALVKALHWAGFRIAIETNGTVKLPNGIDWICVSPKGGPLKVNSGNELKIVYPQQGIDPADYQFLAFKHYFLQPMAGLSPQPAIDYCLAHPRWRLSLQTHKIVGLR